MSYGPEWALHCQPVCVPREYEERRKEGPKPAKYRASKAAKIAAERRAAALEGVVGQIACSLEAKQYAHPDLSPAALDAACEAYVWGALKTLRSRFKAKPEEMEVFDGEVRRLLAAGPPPTPKRQDPNDRHEPSERWPTEVVLLEGLKASLHRGRQRRAAFEGPPGYLPEIFSDL